MLNSIQAHQIKLKFYTNCIFSLSSQIKNISLLVLGNIVNTMNNYEILSKSVTGRKLV